MNWDFILFFLIQTFMRLPKIEINVPLTRCGLPIYMPMPAGRLPRTKDQTKQPLQDLSLHSQV
jgi:hypothetical protein